MSDRSLSAIILAAGAGTRMRSALPKPLHRIAGRPILGYVLDSLRESHASALVVVVGHGRDRVEATVRELDPDGIVSTVEQTRQDGTGDAAAVGLTGLPDELGDDEDVLVLPGDMPLLRPSTVVDLVSLHRERGAAATVLTAVLDDAGSYGRIVRDRDGSVSAIVEARDATPEQLEIREINTAVYCFKRSLLAPALRRLTPDNAQGEYYLTDVIGVLRSAGHRVDALAVEEAAEAEGINDRVQLAAAEAVLRRRTNEAWMRAGVTFVDPDSTYVEPTVRLEADVTLLPGVVLRGSTTVGAGATIGPHACLDDAVVGERAIVRRSDVQGATIGAEAHIGPGSVLGPGSIVAGGRVTGPFYADPGASQD